MNKKVSSESVVKDIRQSIAQETERTTDAKTEAGEDGRC